MTASIRGTLAPSGGCGTDHGVDVEDVAFVSPAIHGGDSGANATGQSLRATTARGVFAATGQPRVRHLFGRDCVDQRDDVALAHIVAVMRGLLARRASLGVGLADRP
jgi:hypothetical protein